MTGERPSYLPPADPTARTFPSSWRDAAVRQLFCAERGGVECPHCKRVFKRPAELRLLQADHIKAYVRGGVTSWENLQLLCFACNASKGAQ
jgi:5-methylcytosine-specific restriction endonuclease McrA